MAVATGLRLIGFENTYVLKLGVNDLAKFATASIFGWATSSAAPSRSGRSAARSGVDAALQTFGADEVAVTLG